MSTNIWNKANQKLVKVSGNATNNINDESSSIKDTWSAKKIGDELGEKADKNNFDVYSTEETVIGTWIDGTKVYRQVFQNVSVEKGLYVDLGVNNVKGVLKISGFPMPIQYYDTAGTQGCIGYYVTPSNKIRITMGSERSMTNNTVIVDYIKTL